MGQGALKIVHALASDARPVLYDDLIFLDPPPVLPLHDELEEVLSGVSGMEVVEAETAIVAVAVEAELRMVLAEWCWLSAWQIQRMVDRGCHELIPRY